METRPRGEARRLIIDTWTSQTPGNNYHVLSQWDIAWSPRPLRSSGQDWFSAKEMTDQTNGAMPSWFSSWDSQCQSLISWPPFQLSFSDTYHLQLQAVVDKASNVSKWLLKFL
jgi:hypothetical protein